MSQYAQEIKRAKVIVENLGRLYDLEVQKLVNKHNVWLATGHMSDTWQVKSPRGRHWKDDMDKPVHPIFAELKALEELGSDFRIGPTNLILVKPQKKHKKVDTRAS